MKSSKVITIILIISMSFLYGFGTGFYKWFPFNQLKEVKRSFSNYTSEGFEFTSAAARNDIIAFDIKRKIIDCPSIIKNLGVLVTFGQSNSANSASYLVDSSEVPDVINWYEGQCYEAKSPLLGATGKNGEWISLTAQHLVKNKTYDKVIVLSLGVGGSSVAAWAEGSELNSRLLNALNDLQKNYKVTDIVWHQGETDLMWGVGKKQYYKTFTNIESSIRKIGIKAPIFLSIASYCKGGIYPNEITRSQIKIVETIDNVVLGINTDELLDSNMRYDDCHFNKNGQQLASKELASIISNYHNQYD